MPDDPQTADYSPDDRLMSIIAAFEAAVDAGENPVEPEWLKRYPDEDARLEAYFADRARFKAIAAPAAEPVVEPFPNPLDQRDLSERVRALNRGPNPTLVEQAVP